MIEYEDIDGKLKAICNHEWTSWYPSYHRDGVEERRHCLKCREEQLLVPREAPKGYITVEDADKLLVKVFIGVFVFTMIFVLYQVFWLY